MTRIPDEIEQGWQLAAECDADAQQAGCADTAGVAAYRQLYRELRQTALPEPPPSYPQDIERLVRLHTDDAATDTPHWGVRTALVMLSLLAVGVMALLPGDVWRHWVAPPGQALWHVLAAAAVAVVVFTAVERWQARMGQHRKP